MSAALIVMGLSAMFAQMGFAPALVQRPDLDDSHIRTGFTSSLALSILLAVGLFLAAPLGAAFFDFPRLTSVLRVVAIEFPLQGIAVVAQALMQRELRFRAMAAVNVAAHAIGYGVIGIALAASGLGVWALVFGHLSRTTITSFSFLVLQRHSIRPGFKADAFKELFKFGGGFTIAKLLNYVARQGDNIVAGRWLGAAALGLYDRAYQLIVFPVDQFGVVTDQVFFPVMSRLQESRQRLLAAFRRAVTIMTTFFGPISVVSFLLAEEIVLVALGSQWTDAIGPFRVLAIGMVFRAGYKVSDTMAQATGAVYRRAWRQGVYSVAVLVGAVIGQRWGLVGLAIGVLAALILNYLLMSHLSISVIDWHWKDFGRAHLPSLLLSAIALIVTLPIVHLLREAAWPDLIVLLAAGATVGSALIAVIAFRPQILGPDQAWMAELTRETLRRRFTKPEQPEPGPDEAESDPEEQRDSQMKGEDFQDPDSADY